jgi:hypothetical protein
MPLSLRTRITKAAVTSFVELAAEFCVVAVNGRVPPSCGRRRLPPATALTGCSCSEIANA